MNDFVNNNKNIWNDFSLNTVVNKTNNSEIKTPELKSDSYESQKKETNSDKKINKKKIAKITAAVACALLGIVMFVKRKEISGFISELFNKKQNSIQKNLPKKNADIPLDKSNQVLPEKSENLKKTIVDKNKTETMKEATKKVSEISSASKHPFPVLSENPTKENLAVYDKELLKFLDTGITPEEKIKALNEIEKYGTSNLDEITRYLMVDFETEEVVSAAQRVIEKWGGSKYATSIISPITDISADTDLTKKSKLYTETLKAIQRTANLNNYTTKEKNTIFFEPIERLLNHSDEKVRQTAQETLDMLQKQVNN